VEHLRTIGLKVAQRASKTGKIASVACRLCFNFGREPHADASEAATAVKKSKYKTKTFVKQFSQPWRTDAFITTPQAGAQGKMGGVRWAGSPCERWFLWRRLKRVLREHLDAHLDDSSRAVFFWISENIVMKVLGEMLFAALESKEKV
jgi:hypothetical protein